MTTARDGRGVCLVWPTQRFVPTKMELCTYKNIAFENFCDLCRGLPGRYGCVASFFTGSLRCRLPTMIAQAINAQVTTAAKTTSTNRSVHFA